MSIHFSCEHCGHTIDVGEHLAGAHGHCKHCGQSMVVPSAHADESATPMRLRPIESDEPSAHAPAAAAAPVFEPPPPHGKPASPYGVLGEDEPERVLGKAVKVREQKVLRTGLKVLRTARNWLYVGSVLFLALAAYGYFLKDYSALKWGTYGVVASNIGMLVTGVVYLVSIPFRESFLHGLANVVIPGYAFYYWATRWASMKKPVLNTVGSFLPIFLVAVAILIYKEKDVIKEKIERLEGNSQQPAEPGSARSSSGEPGSASPPSHRRRRRPGGMNP